VTKKQIDENKKNTHNPPEELFALEEQLTDAAYEYGQDTSNENRRAVRLAACEYAALAFKLGAS
jgi:hypothetical protein